MVKCTAAIFFRTADWPVKREIRNSFKSVVSGLRAGGMTHCGPWLELLGFARLLASSTEFSGSDFKVSPLPPLLVAVDIAYPHHSVRPLSWWSRFPPITRDYDLTTATSMKTSLKNRLRILSNHFAIIPSRQVLKRREFMLELKGGAAPELRQR